MKWSEIRQTYPDQWLVVEALQAHTTPEKERILDRIAVIETAADGSAAMNSYRQWHLRFPGREFYFVHTSRAELDIREREWVGIRRNDDAIAVKG